MARMVSPELVKAYNEKRVCTDKSVLCHAPFANIYFSANGSAFACCYNSVHVLGTYPDKSLREIWFGSRANLIREAMKSADLPSGCGACAHQLESRNFSGLMHGFDRYAQPRATAPDDGGRTTIRTVLACVMQRLMPSGNHGDKGWAPRATSGWTDPPRAMEFSLSAVCNLECVMCDGHFSSAIRRNREKMPPARNPYDSDFVKQLDEFIPRLSVAKFYGGEPFLIDIYYDIWDRIRKLKPDVEVHITTNATVLNERVKRTLEDLDCRLILSIDTMEKETFERIRVNASFEQIMRNVAYFAQYSVCHGHRLTMVACPMQQNWREIPALLRYCNEHNIDLGFNTVYRPPECSLRTMNACELAEVVDYWQSCRSVAATDPARSNGDHFEDVTRQAARWLEEIRARRDSSPNYLPAVGPAELLDSNCIHEQMRSAFLGILASAQDEPDGGNLEDGAYEATRAAMLKELRAYMEGMSRQLSEETFVRYYFRALKEAYVEAYRSVSPEDKDMMLAKFEVLQNSGFRQPSMQAFIAFLVNTDIAVGLVHLRDYSVEDIEHLIDTL